LLFFPVKPMLLCGGDPFNSEDHIFELKVDGIRCIMFYTRENVRLQSKTGRDCTRAYPDLLNPVIHANEAVLDGEITILTTGKPDFEAVMERYHTKKERLAPLLSKKPAIYIVWDMLWLDGSSVMGLPLMQRKIILDETLESDNFVVKIDWVDTDGMMLFEAVKAQGLEGMVAKKKHSRYEPGRRSSAWVKAKAYQYAVVNVFGYSKKDGSILVGTDRIQGHAIGMKSEEKKVLWRLLDSYGTEKNNMVWLPPGIQGKVKFTTWSSRGNMRDCSWQNFEV